MDAATRGVPPYMQWGGICVTCCVCGVCCLSCRCMTETRRWTNRSQRPRMCCSERPGRGARGSCMEDAASVDRRDRPCARAVRRRYRNRADPFGGISAAQGDSRPDGARQRRGADSAARRADDAAGAELLQVSRTHLVQLLDNGGLPAGRWARTAVSAPRMSSRTGARRKPAAAGRWMS